MSLFQACISSLKGSSIPTDELKSTILTQTAKEIDNFREKFHRVYRGVPFNSSIFYSQILPSLKKMIKNSGDDEINKTLEEIRLRDETDPLRQKVAYLMNNKYEMNYNEFWDAIKKTIGFKETTLEFDQPVSNIYCNNRELSYHWDLDNDYKLVNTEFFRSENLVEEEEFDPWNATPLSRHTRFLFNSLLIEIEYHDYLNDYFEGDDLYVRVLFDVPKRLDALLLEPISKKPPKGWSVCSRRAEALI